MAALGAVAGDIYLPSLPEVVADLSTTRSWVQTTITATMFGGAAGQLLIGPLSDRYGRRTPVLFGLALHVAASVGIVFTPSVAVLIALRFVQGIGNASAAVVAMAMIRDLHSGHRAAKLLSQIVLVIGVAPLLAPTLGSALAALGTWRYTFVFLAVAGVGLGAFVYLRVPDTRSSLAKAAAPTLGGAFRAYGHLLRDYRFMGWAMVPALAQSALMAWVISSPFLIQEHYGQGHGTFSLLFAVCGVFLIAGAQANASVVHRFSPAKLLRWVLPVELAVAVAGFAFSFTHFGGLWGLVAGVSVLLFLNGFVPSNASALALTRHGEAAGAASALIGSLQAAFVAGVMALLSALGDSQHDMTGVQAGALAGAWLIVLAGTFGASRSRRRRNSDYHGERF
jgi:DHA1 family bicyclomycin/chloramphenicol resistance-like MFS transporter